MLSCIISLKEEIKSERSRNNHHDDFDVRKGPLYEPNHFVSIASRGQGQKISSQSRVCKLVITQQKPNYQLQVVSLFRNQNGLMIYWLL
jgi:hypothetical protein